MREGVIVKCKVVRAYQIVKTISKRVRKQDQNQ